MKRKIETLKIKGDPCTRLYCKNDIISVGNLLIRVIEDVWSDSNGDAIVKCKYLRGKK